MVWRERHHLGGQPERCLQLLPLLFRGRFGDHRAQLFDGRVVIVDHPFVLRGEVIV